MLLSDDFVKLRSLGVSSLVLAFTIGAAGAASTGCFFVDDDHGSQYDDYDDYDDDNDVTPPIDDQKPDSKDPMQVSIQPDQVLEAKPGEGVGIFVEYRPGGMWRIWTTCDTFVSKAVCSFDIFASARVPTDLRSYATEDVEGYDTVADLGDGTVELLADTDSDTDGLLLEMEPGTSLTLEVYLDGDADVAQKIVYWVSGDVIHAGAPSNPVEFLPASP